jgi:DNA-directed RNA polymerase specialized sigma24 family protein
VSESALKAAVAEPVAYLQGHTRTWNDSWQRLYSSWNEVIVAFCLRQGLNQQSAQKVCQETMITLLRSHHGQAGYDSRQGSFQSWLWGVVRNRVKAERRRHTNEILVAPVQETRDGDRIDSAPVLSEPPPDFGRAEGEQERQAVWVAALQRVRQRVKPENFEIYAALLEESGTPEALARKHGKTVNNIYAIKHRCDDLLLKEARSIRKQQGHFTT